MDGASIFFTTGPSFASGAALRVLPREGGAARVLVQARVGSFAIDDTHVYFVERSDLPSGAVALRRTAKSGGAPETLATIGADTSIVVDERHVYFNDPVRRFVRIPKGGGSLEDVAAEGANRAVALARGHIYWEYGGVFRRVRKP
jgi:hypothetical protein